MTSELVAKLPSLHHYYYYYYFHTFVVTYLSLFLTAAHIFCTQVNMHSDASNITPHFNTIFKNVYASDSCSIHRYIHGIYTFTLCVKSNMLLSCASSRVLERWRGAQRTASSPGRHVQRGIGGHVDSALRLGVYII